MARLNANEQNELVTELISNLEQFDEDEFEERYDKLDAKHQAEVDDSVTRFANGAVGSDDWDQD